MILKKLEIQGFKSFADRTEVVFTPGMTAVVGPNGSGKSNISDALLWVLGEQNVRSIRGQKAQDVIFSGSGKRRPTGMAEVSLTLDNSSGILPVDYSEVTITRRAYRSGESEFYINKAACRLKDIYELFLDTGVGREAYSIISQGEMDAMLSARSEDRRALLDEAAGIKKYRHRKKEAERKLENVQGNLNRVNDIVSEIQVEIDPMAEQAEIAKRYLELAERLREIEVGILAHDLRRFTAEIETIRSDKDSDSKGIEEADLHLAAREERKSALEVDLSNADAQVETFGSIYQDAVTQAERTESQLALVRQRHQSAAGALERLAEEIRQLESRISAIESQQLNVSAEREEAEAEESKINALLLEKNAELDAVQGRMRSASKAVEDQKSNYIELAKKLATQRNELANTEGRIESLQALLSRRSAEFAEAGRSAEHAKSECETAQAKVDSTRTELAEVATSMAALREALQEKQRVSREIISELERINRQLVDKSSRLKTLREMEDAKEGYYHGVRTVFAGLKANRISGGFSVVADVIKVPRGYETAYEVALGGSLQDIITDTDREAKSAIEFLKMTKGGRATFLPLNMMRHSQSPMLKEYAGKHGILGLGNELISFDPKYAPAIDSLLSRVLIAKDLDSAVAVSRSAAGWSKIVTLEGELVFPSGAMTGGQAPTKTVNILGRKQEIDSLASDVRSLTSDGSGLQKKNEGLKGEIETVSKTLSETETNDTRLKMSLLEGERRLEFAVREEKRLSRELDGARTERDSLQENLRKAKETQSALVLAIETADKENTSLDGLMSQTEGEMKKLQAECDSITVEINSASVTLASLAQKRISVERVLEDSESAIRDHKAEIARKQRELGQARDDSGNTEQRTSELEKELKTAREACDRTLAQCEQWRKTKQSLLTSSMDVNDQIKSLSRKREELTQKVHSAELREARLDMQIAQSIARLAEEYDISAEVALAMEPSEERNGSAAEVIRLRREIRGMGEVNTGAVQEYERLKERFAFLSAQRQDLMDAKDDLSKAIREIDEGTRGIFMETFNAVSTAFNSMFQRLFGGGSTELVLTNPEDILETGIDVMIELPGKKRQNLLLLSGGERALTAAALMFALMSVRPSPFCLLDEVDAPLDESNVFKFADMLKEFAERTQMIVITHNKNTMEAADVLYGVTMQEPGISTLVSVKLSEVAERN
jgi:chromosome segregation protein